MNPRSHAWQYSIGFALALPWVLILSTGLSHAQPKMPQPKMPGAKVPKAPHVPRPPQPGGPAVIVWSCSNCNKEVGRGEKPFLANCPFCGIRFVDGGPVPVAAVNRDSGDANGAQNRGGTQDANESLGAMDIAALVILGVMLIGGAVVVVALIVWAIIKFGGDSKKKRRKKRRRQRMDYDEERDDFD